MAVNSILIRRPSTLVLIAAGVFGLLRAPSSRAMRAVAAGSTQQAADPTSEQAKLHKLPTKSLPNAIQITPKVISGGQPDGEKGFEELEKLGVKTIISVDGAKPDLAAAKKHGLRYVHLPHGYDGIPDERVKELAKAVKELNGPIYIHCHHGKHRSPAAAAAACAAAGLIEPKQAIEILKLAGTHENYRGLYALAREVKRIDDRSLAELQVEFKETVKIPPLAEAMIELEHTHDHLKLAAAAKWKSLGEHPDIDPAHEALLLREHFTELLRNDAVAKESQQFKDLLLRSESAAKDLEAALKESPRSEASLVKSAAAFEVVSKQCTACHQAYRDVPLDEKKK
jgi:protein tyrosine phosphatase (PTP) superfamily phosphohydrolase (DUF442 family)